MGGCQDDWLAALLLEERSGGGLQNEFGALNALVLVTLREEEQKQGPGTAIGEGGGAAPERWIRCRRNGRVRQMERKRRKRSRR